MSGIRAERARRIDEALRARASGVEASGAARWSFTLSNGKAAKVEADLAEDWLHLGTTLGQIARGRARAPRGTAGPSRAAAMSSRGLPWRMLGWNSCLPGLGRFALGDGECVELRADLPLDEEMDLPGRLEETCSSLRLGLALYHGEQPGCDGRVEERIGEGAEPPPLPPANGGGLDLSQLCKASGWEFTERSEGKLAVALDVPGDFFQAFVEKKTIRGAASRGVTLSVELLGTDREPPDSSNSRQALALMLVRAAHAVRMARPAIVEADGRFAVRLDASFGELPCPAELSHALAALSVASRMVGREVAALQEDRIATDYLRVSGWIE